MTSVPPVVHVRSIPLCCRTINNPEVMRVDGLVSTPSNVTDDYLEWHDAEVQYWPLLHLLALKRSGAAGSYGSVNLE